MKEIKEYIDESIFGGGDIIKNTEDALKQEVIDELGKYIYDYKRISRYFDINLGPKGYEITNNGSSPYVSAQSCVLTELPDKGLKYKISKFRGGLLYLNSIECTDLTAVFTPDCEFDGGLVISWCGFLTSLDGCPKKVDKFDCSFNKGLISIEGAPRECKFFRWANNGIYVKGYSAKKPKKDMEPTEKNIRKYLKSKTAHIELT